MAGGSQTVGGQGEYLPPDQVDPGYVPTASEWAAINAPKPGVGARVGIFIPDHPELPANQNYGWTNSQTGEHLTGGLTPDGRQIITGFTGPNPQNTTSYDVTNGKQSQADPHQWWDAAKNAALIFGGSETAGLLMGAWGAPTVAGGISPQIAQTAELPAIPVGEAGALPAGLSTPAITGSLAGPGAGAIPVGAAGTIPAVGTPADIAPSLLNAAPTVTQVAPTVSTSGFSGLGGLKKWLPLAGPAAKVFQGIESQRQAGMAMDQYLAEQQNKDALEIARQKALAQAGQVNQQIAQKSLQAGDYQRNLKNAIQAGLLDPVNGVQDINFNLPDRIASHMGNVTGGLRPSAISNRGAISSEVGPQALEALKHNPTTNDLLPPAGYSEPNLTPYPTPNGLDTGLGYAGLIASGLSAFSQLWPRPSTVQGGNFDTSQFNLGRNTTFQQPQVGSNPLYTVPRAFQGVNFYGGG